MYDTGVFSYTSSNVATVAAVLVVSTTLFYLIRRSTDTDFTDMLNSTFEQGI